MNTLPMTPGRLIGAACSLNADEMRERLAEWRGARDRATSMASRSERLPDTRVTALAPAKCR